ncbi:MAG: sulfatase-like hydrolase/transferase, partial [Myxococcota bacterium]
MLLLAWLACAEAPDGPPGALAFDGPPPRNVLLLSIDTLRADAVTADDMPFLAGLAAQGVALADHVQCSDWTWPSTACTLLGRLPEDLGLALRIPPAPHEALPDGLDPLAVRLGAAGYATALVSRNAWLGPLYGNAQGYDVHDWGAPDATGTLERGAALIRERQGGPWLVHVHLMEPHAPYVPPDAYLDEEA